MKNIENKKLPQMLSFNMCEGPKKIWHHFGLFLSLFSAFHLKFLQLCKKPQSYISGTHQLLFPLVNNGQNWCQKLWTFFSPLLILQGECEIWSDQFPQHMLSSHAIGDFDNQDPWSSPVLNFHLQIRCSSGPKSHVVADGALATHYTLQSNINQTPF